MVPPHRGAGFLRWRDRAFRLDARAEQDEVRVGGGVRVVRTAGRPEADGRAVDGPPQLAPAVDVVEPVQGGGLPRHVDALGGHVGGWALRRLVRGDCHAHDGAAVADDAEAPAVRARGLQRLLPRHGRLHPDGEARQRGEGGLRGDVGTATRGGGGQGRHLRGERGVVRLRLDRRRLRPHQRRDRHEGDEQDDAERDDA